MIDLWSEKMIGNNKINKGFRTPERSGYLFKLKSTGRINESGDWIVFEVAKIQLLNSKSNVLYFLLTSEIFAGRMEEWNPACRLAGMEE